jgi:hypothetical protein
MPVGEEWIVNASEKVKKISAWLGPLALAVPLLLVLGFLLSCPQPFTGSILQQVKDTVIPDIVIFSPEDGSSYAATVIVTGRVTDHSFEAGGEVRRLFFELTPPTIPPTEIPIESDGSFSFSFATANMAGPLVITLHAEDWNGNVSTKTVTLLDEGAIPSFTASATNHEVELEWDDVPLASSYTVYFSRDGLLPSPYYGDILENVNSPLPVSGLENGKLHIFLLQAHSAEGEDNWSEYVEAIPLSEHSLAPHVSDEYGKLKISWAPIPATDRFELWRSSEPEGPYTALTRSWTGYGFTDTDVGPCEGYYYKVCPSLSGSLLSQANYGARSPFPDKRLIYSLDCDCETHDVVLSGNRAYVTGAEGLRIIDIGVPDSIWLVDSVPIPGDNYGLAISGNTACVANWDEGLAIVDLGNPGAGASHVDVSSLVNPAFSDVAILDDTAYVADVINGLHLISIPNAEITQTVALPSGSKANGVAVDPAGVFAYVAAGNEGLIKIDLTPPSYPTTQIPLDGYAWGIALEGNLAYVAADTGGLYIVDISTDTVYGPVLTTKAFNVCVAGDFAYLADGSSGLKIIRVDSPDLATVVKTVDTIGFSWAAASADRYVYLADGIGGLQVVDLLDPLQAEVVHTVPTGSACSGVAAQGDLAVIADGWAGLKIVDLGAADPPASVKTLALEECTYHAVISGDFAYVADGYAGLQIVDIHDPAIPSVVGNAPTVNYAYRVAVSGDYAYVACSSSGLQIFDVSTPGDARLVGVVPTTGSAEDIAVEDGFAYVADRGAGVRIVDVSTPGTAQQVAVDSDAGLNGLTVCGDLLFSAYGGYINIHDISDPAAPRSVTSVNISGCGDVEVAGDYAYVACGSYGVAVVDVSDPELTRFIGTISVSGVARQVVASGCTLLVACDNVGLDIIDLIP